MASRQTTIHGAATVQDGAPTDNNYVLVWSAMRYPYTLKHVVSRYNNKKEAGGRNLVEQYTLRPGSNRVPRSLWDAVKNKDTVALRVDRREIVVSDRSPGDHKDKMDAISKGVAPDKYSSILALCPAAEKTTMKAAMKAAGAVGAIADIDDDGAPVTLES